MTRQISEAHPRRPDDIETVTYSDRLVLIDPVTGRLAQLDPLAALVWLYADGTRTCSEIAAQLSRVCSLVEVAGVVEVVGLLAENAFLSLEV